MSPETKAIYDAMWTLPTADRLNALVLSVIERETKHPNAVPVMTALVQVVATMARGMSTLNRFKVSSALRDAADCLEKPEVDALLEK